MPYKDWEKGKNMDVCRQWTQNINLHQFQTRYHSNQVALLWIQIILPQRRKQTCEEGFLETSWDRKHILLRGWFFCSLCTPPHSNIVNVSTRQVCCISSINKIREPPAVLPGPKSEILSNKKAEETIGRNGFPYAKGQKQGEKPRWKWLASFI